MLELSHSRRNEPDRLFATKEAKEYIDSLLKRYSESRHAKGERGVNQADMPRYFRHLENIIADLHAAWQSDPSLYVGYSRGKANFIRSGSYWDELKDRPVLSYTFFVNAIDFLSEIGLIEDHPAPPGDRPFSSRMRATPALIDELEKRKINWASNGIDLNASAIIVKDEHKKKIAPPNDPGFDLIKAERNLRRINANLQWSLINLNVTDREYEILRRRMKGSIEDGVDVDDEGYRAPLDFSNRHLKRVFAHGSFQYGGRFYGGWWQSVPSEYRKFIEIEGCITCEMDYSTIQPRILYARANAESPADAYAVPGWDKGIRKITKKAFNQLVDSTRQCIKLSGVWRGRKRPRLAF